MNETKLTPAQESFAQLVAAGKSQSEAYRTAYPKAQAWKDEAVWTRASRLFANVLPRVEQLRAELATQTLWTMEQATTLLVDVATNLDERAGDRIKAIAELNKLHGFGVAKAADETVIVRWYGL